MDQQPLDLDLDAIEIRYAEHLRRHSHIGAFACCSAHASADDVPAMAAEIRLLAAKLATMTAVAESNKRYVQSMYRDLQQAQAAVASEKAVNAHLVDKHTATLAAADEWTNERAQLLADNHQLTTELEQARAAAFTEAARLLENTGHDDDAVNLLDIVAAGITTHAPAPAPAAASGT